MSINVCGRRKYSINLTIEDKFPGNCVHKCLWEEEIFNLTIEEYIFRKLCPNVCGRKKFPISQLRNKFSRNVHKCLWEEEIFNLTIEEYILRKLCP